MDFREPGLFADKAKISFAAERLRDDFGADIGLEDGKPSADWFPDEVEFKPLAEMYAKARTGKDDAAKAAAMSELGALWGEMADGILGVLRRD